MTRLVLTGYYSVLLCLRGFSFGGGTLRTYIHAYIMYLTFPRNFAGACGIKRVCFAHDSRQPHSHGCPSSKFAVSLPNEALEAGVGIS